MKKLFLTKMMLLLCALIAGSGSVWAEEVTTTYIFTNRDWNATSNSQSADWTCNTRAGGYSAAQGAQITTCSTGANATSPISFTNIKKITVQYCTNKSKGSGDIKVKVGTGTEQSFDASYTSGTGTALKERNMKKTYSNPSLEVIKTATQQMLALSDSTTGTKFDTTQTTSDMDGRSFDFDEE